MNLTLAALAIASACYQEPAQVPPLPVKPPPIPTGVIPLPQGPPNTAPQSTTPAPAKPLPKGTNPLAWSPDIAAVEANLAKRPITINEAVAVALYTSKNFATAAAELAQASARHGEAKDQLNPTLGVNAQITQFDEATVVALAPGSPSITLVPLFNPVFTAALTIPLDLFGTVRSAASQAQFTEVAAKIDVSKVRNDVVYNVRMAFYNVLRSQAQVAVATDNVNNTLRRLSDANKNYAAGTNSRFDVITAQRDVANSQQALIVAHSQVTVNLAALKMTMGVSISSRLSVTSAGAVEYPDGVPPANPAGASQTLPTFTGNLQTPQPTPGINRDVASPKDPGGKIVPLTAPSVDIVTDDFDWGPDFDGLLQEARRNRPEIQEADAQIAAGRKGLQYARRSFLPDLSLSLSDQYTPYNTPFTRQNQGIATLSISVPIYDGGLGRDRVHEQEGVIAAAQVNRRQMEDQVLVDVQQAYIALVQARQRVAVANVEVAQAQETFRVSRIRYETGASDQTGISPQLEISNAQTSLAQAEADQVNALYDYNNAHAQLDRALGRYSYSQKR